MKKGFWIVSGTLVGLYFGMKAVARKKSEPKSIDEDNPYIKIEKMQNKPLNVYEGRIKKVLDQIISFGGLVILCPVYGIISLAVYLDDPGPVFFTQKRVGKDKHYFMLHKFRSMKMNTPHDIPTHMLENPEQYITRVGKFLRKSSLDELPQVWDIFRGKMSVIGPRPALWNQDDLVKERDKYCVNSLMPGLTGLAQIRGRNELEIFDKAKLDGEYVANLRKDSLTAFKQDVFCFIDTIVSVIKRDGIVEGGMGAIHAKDSLDERMETVDPSDVGFEDYGFKKCFHIDKGIQKKVLITGEGSYIGESFVRWVQQYYSNIDVTTIDMIDGKWRERDFRGFDAVLHVAGIAHADIGNVDESVKVMYYAVNTDLAVETAEIAKKEGVSQFIFMSSMIIYGDSTSCGKKKIIDENTVPAPTNFYGDSIWQADKKVRQLADNSFSVAVLRLPMIYGKGCKGNYPLLAKLAKKLSVFPDVENERSMLHIDNLCEFLSLLILSGEGGIYFPQNGEYTKTADMVEQIGKINGRSIYPMKILNPLVSLAAHIPGKIGTLTDKAFENSIYSQRLSIYQGLDYRVNTLRQSIVLTEKTDKSAVLILVNHDVVIYNFRLELVERLLDDGYEVHISSPYGERINDLIALGAQYHEISIDRHGMNPVKEYTILRNYRKLISEVKPFVVLGYTVKPNIYGAMAAQIAHVPFVANITGLGTAVGNAGWRQRLIVFLYKYAFTNVQRVFFQNDENEKFFKDNAIAVNKHALLPGSGVNLQRYTVSPLPDCGDGKNGRPVKFAYISRIMKEKGIDQYLAAAEAIRKQFPATEFHICGFCEDKYEGRLEKLTKSGMVIYHGMIRDVAGFMGQMHCIVHPTYYPEGLSNVLLEASACGRAIITTDRSGCREVVNDGVNGYLVPMKDVNKLIYAIEKFLCCSQDEKKTMGLAGRKLVEKRFDRQIVVDAYMDEIHFAELKQKGNVCAASTVTLS